MTMLLSGERPMLTSWCPTATSFNIAVSNFNTSLDMGTPSLSSWILGCLKPSADLAYCAVLFRRVSQHNRSNVVAATRMIRLLDQRIGGLLRPSRFLQNSRDLWLGKLAKQSVGTKQVGVALAQKFFGNFHVHVLLHTQRACQHVLHAAAPSLLRSDDSAAHLLGDEGMIFRELVQLLVAKQISPAISDVRDAYAILEEAHGHNRRAHAAFSTQILRGLMNFPVGEPNGACEAIAHLTHAFDLLAENRQRRIGVGIAAMRQYRLGRQAAGPFAGLQPAHAVRQHEQVQLRRQPEAVFIVLANTPCIAARANFHRISLALHRSRSVASSKFAWPRNLRPMDITDRTRV